MPPLPKLDLYKLHKNEYVTPRKPVLLTMTPARYLSISGQGAPGGPEFVARIGALYGVAFTVKMTRKFAGQQDYAVCKLEGQWFFGDGNCPATLTQDKWRWCLLIRTPDFITEADLDQAVATLLKRGKAAEVKEVKLTTLTEDRCVQMLHFGPYDQESKTVDAMRAYTESQGLKLVGPHHEIYLSDPRRVAPERLKTILREPVAEK